MTILPFYAAEDPELFAIERTAMDRPGRVIDLLDRVLPEIGLVLDVGAGDGFTAARLARAQRPVVGLDPEVRTMRPDRPLRWVGGEAERLPFGAATFAAAYATWAYFFTDVDGFDPSPGRAEVERVVADGGPVAIVDNLGGDEFTALSEQRIWAAPEWWTRRGYELHVVDTEFAFDTIEDAQRLLGSYFGDRGRDHARLKLSYRVGVFVGPA